MSTPYFFSTLFQILTVYSLQIIKSFEYRKFIYLKKKGTFYRILDLEFLFIFKSKYFKIYQLCMLIVVYMILYKIVQDIYYSFGIGK